MTAHTNDPRVLASGDYYQGLLAEQTIREASRVGWDALAPTQTLNEIHDSLHCAFKNAGLNLFSLDKELENFTNSGFWKLGANQSTSSPADFSIEVVGCRIWACATYYPAIKVAVIPAPTAAICALERIKNGSGLTIEALAPLVGVSRRTLHLWLSGGQISQRNEERLRALAESIEAIAAVAPETTRERLMERIPGFPRIYDLLAEGRFESAIARGTGVFPLPRPVVYPAAAKPQSVSVDVLANALHDMPPLAKSRIDLRLTKRLR
jgi:hypothetical protein